MSKSLKHFSKITSHFPSILTQDFDFLHKVPSRNLDALLTLLVR